MEPQRNNTLTILGILLLIALLAGGGILAWSLLNNKGDEMKQPSYSIEDMVKDGKEVILSEDELKALAASHPPLYWAGPRDNTKYGVTVTSHNGIFIRYLPITEQVGTTNEYLSVATYTSIGYEALARAKKTDVDFAKTENGALIVTPKSKPTHTYFSFPNAAFQVEVFSPEDKQARTLVEDGSIRLVGKNEE